VGRAAEFEPCVGSCRYRNDVFVACVRSSSNTAVRTEAQLNLHRFAESGLAAVKLEGLQLGPAGPGRSLRLYVYVQMFVWLQCGIHVIYKSLYVAERFLVQW
jgi:hypothetical protein